MNGKDLQDAVEFVGDDLLDMAEHRQFRKSPWRKVLPVAAVFAILLGVGAGIYHQYNMLSPSPALTQPDSVEEVAPSVPDSDIPSTDPVEPVDKIAVSPILEVFPMIDPESLDACIGVYQSLDEATLQLNEAGLNKSGTTIFTKQGDQVLALDMVNKILLLRVRGYGYQGVLAICKDPTKLTLQPSSQLGTMGETVGTIAQAHGGILAINGSGFPDDNGQGTGHSIWGYAMHDGVPYTKNGDMSPDRARLEIDQDGWFHLTKAGTDFRPDTQNAVTFGPALIENGTILVDEDCGYTGIQPRSVIGQADDGSVMLLVIEGRQPPRSMGTDVIQCANILARYNCQTAINLDGGTSSIMWYQGEPVTQCSNPKIPDGRLLPDAFVIQGQS